MLDDIENLDPYKMAQVHQYLTRELNDVSKALSPTTLIFESSVRPNSPPLTADRFFKFIGFDEEFEGREKLFQSFLNFYQSFSGISIKLPSYLSAFIKEDRSRNIMGTA